jgi:hypothetical protein
MIQGFPRRGADGYIPHQTQGAILEAFADVEDLAVRQARVLVGALRGWVACVPQADYRFDAPLASLTTEPLVALTLGIEPVGGESIAKGTQGASAIIVAAKWPPALVLVGLVGAEVDHPSGLQFVDGVQEDVEAKAGIAHDSVEVQVGIEELQLQEKGGGWHVLLAVRCLKVLEQAQVKAADRVGQ